MTFENIASGLKLAMFIASIIKNPEEAMLKVIDDFSDTENSELSELKASLCKKIECDSINIVAGEECVSVEFSGIRKPLDVFAIDLVGYVYNLLDKVKMFIDPFLPEGVSINKTLNNLSVVHNEITNNVMIKFPVKEDTLSLEVKYGPEEKIASIEIPIKSEKVLNKLKDMKEK